MSIYVLKELYVLWAVLTEGYYICAGDLKMYLKCHYMYWIWCYATGMGYWMYCELYSPNVLRMKSNDMDRVLNVMSNKERIGVGIIKEAIYAINIWSTVLPVYAKGYQESTVIAPQSRNEGGAETTGIYNTQVEHGNNILPCIIGKYIHTEQYNAEHVPTSKRMVPVLNPGINIPYWYMHRGESTKETTRTCHHKHGSVSPTEKMLESPRTF